MSGSGSYTKGLYVHISFNFLADTSKSDFINPNFTILYMNTDEVVLLLFLLFGCILTNSISVQNVEPPKRFSVQRKITLAKVLKSVKLE